MTLDSYNLRISTTSLSFRFVSEGRNGEITKGILFTCIEEPLVWNLGFGDIDPISGEISDLAVSDNEDSEKILATVAQATLIFSERYPEAIIFAEGSTRSQTRLYRIGISKNLAEISAVFAVWGLIHDC